MARKLVLGFLMVVRHYMLFMGFQLGNEHCRLSGSSRACYVKVLGPLIEEES